MERFEPSAVHVRAAKPEPPMPVTVGEAAVEVTLRRQDAEGDSDDG